MTDRLPSWRRVADVLAERLRHAAAAAGSVPPNLPERCDVRGCGHREANADPDNCPFCADRAAYRLWEKKSGAQ